MASADRLGLQPDHQWSVSESPGDKGANSDINHVKLAAEKKEGAVLLGNGPCSLKHRTLWNN